MSDVLWLCSGRECCFLLQIHSLLTDYGNAAENGKDEEKHGHGRGRRAHRRHGHEHKRRKELDVNAAQQFRVSKDGLLVCLCFDLSFVLRPILLTMPDFMRVWEASYRRTMAARTNAREVLSGNAPPPPAITTTSTTTATTTILLLAVDMSWQGSL